MPHAPKSYDDWLALSDDERREVHAHEWDVYRRDGVGFAFMAASRLALQSKRKILDIQIGTYHGGEYVLRLTVSAEDYRECPPMLAESFEGFRIVWFPEPKFQAPAGVAAFLEGKWRAEEGDYEFELQWNGAGVEVRGKSLKTGEILQISRSMINKEYVLFSAFEPGRSAHSDHILALVSPDRCENRTTATEYYERVRDRG